MTQAELVKVVKSLAEILDANSNQRLTEAMSRGILLTLELRLQPAIVVPASTESMQ